MNDYKLTPAERETIILWDEEADIVNLETYDTRLIRLLEKATNVNPEFYHYLGTNQYGGVSYEFPRELLRLSFCNPISKEKRKQMSERAKAENMIERLQRR